MNDILPLDTLYCSIAFYNPLLASHSVLSLWLLPPALPTPPHFFFSILQKVQDSSPKFSSGSTHHVIVKVL